MMVYPLPFMVHINLLARGALSSYAPHLTVHATLCDVLSPPRPCFGAGTTFFRLGGITTSVSVYRMTCGCVGGWSPNIQHQRQYISLHLPQEKCHKNSAPDFFVQAFSSFVFPTSSSLPELSSPSPYSLPLYYQLYLTLTHFPSYFSLTHASSTSLSTSPSLYSPRPVYIPPSFTHPLLFQFLIRFSPFTASSPSFAYFSLVHPSPPCLPSPYLPPLLFLLLFLPALAPPSSRHRPADTYIWTLPIVSNTLSSRPPHSDSLQCENLGLDCDIPSLYKLWHLRKGKGKGRREGERRRHKRGKWHAYIHFFFWLLIPFIPSSLQREKRMNLYLCAPFEKWIRAGWIYRSPVMVKAFVRA